MRTVLVTGAYGFLGRYVSRAFKKSGWRVIGIGHGHWGFEQPSDFGIDLWFEADVDLYALTKIQEDLDCSVHCAGGASVGYSVQYPLRDFNRTVTSAINLLEYLRLYHPETKFIYPSSAAVYGKKTNSPIKEDDELCPVSPYGFHKRIVEQLCTSYWVNFDLSVAIIRFFSIYGPGLKKQLLWDACNRLSKTREEIEFFGTGDETRDWIHVRDAAALILRMAESQKRFEVVNGGTGRALAIRDILTRLASLFDRAPRIGFNGKSRPGDPRHYWADISRARAIGWQPQISIDHGLKEYFEWFRREEKD